MLRRELAWICLLPVLLCSLSSAGAEPPPSAAKRVEARAKYDSGLRLFDIGKYDDAATEFEAAYTLSGSPEILYNVGQSYRLAQKYDKALLFYRSYIRRMASPANRVEVERRITELTALIDQQKKAVEATPTTTIRTPQDEQPDGTKPHTTDGGRVPPPVVIVPVEPPKPPPRWMKPLGFAFLGVAVAGIAVGAAGLALSSSASSDVHNAAAAGTNPFSADLKNKESQGKSFDSMGIAGFAVGGVFAVAGAVTLGIAYKRSKASRQARVAPLLGPGVAGAMVMGAF